MNVPNLLTISRLVLIPVFLLLDLKGQQTAALLVVLVAGLTDLLDGYIARRSGQVTRTGMMLDPLADKLMMLAVVGALVAGGEIPWPAAITMGIREAGMIASSTYYHFRGRMTLPANIYGKLTTAVYYLAIVLLFLDVAGGTIVLWIAIVLSFMASAVYFAKFKRLNQAV